MASNVSICNRALNLIGQKTITSLTEQSSQAIKCNLVFEDTRDLVLSEAWWNFASVEEALGLISDASTVKYDYVYSYPALCLAIRDIYNEYTVLVSKPGVYEVIDYSGIKAIATNVEDAYLKYTKRVVDPSVFSLPFIEALIYRLASVLAHQLTGSPELADNMLQKSLAYVSEAKRLNQQEGIKVPDPQTPYINVRG
jgi:hypothetical protein